MLQIKTHSGGGGLAAPTAPGDVRLVADLPDTPCKALARIAYNDVYKVHLARILKDDSHPKWLNDGYKNGFYESSIWDYVRNVVADNAVEFNQNKNNIIKIAVEKPALFSRANWNALLLKTSINRMFDDLVVPEEKEIDAAAKIILENEEYGKFWVNSEQTISDIKVYSKALRLAELIKDIKINRHARTFNDPETNKACFEDDPEKNEVQLTKDVSLRWNWRSSSNSSEDATKIMFDAMVRFADFKLFPDSVDKANAALLSYKLEHESGYDGKGGSSNCSIYLYYEEGQKYHRGLGSVYFDYSRMRFEGDRLSHAAFLWYKGKNLGCWDESWLCFPNYLPLKSDCFFTFFENRLFRSFPSISTLTWIFGESSWGKNWKSGLRFLDDADVIFFVTKEEWMLIHSLLTEEKYMLDFSSNDSLKERLNALHKHFGYYEDSMDIIKSIFDVWEYSGAAFTETFFTDEYFKGKLDSYEIKKINLQIKNDDDLRKLALMAWLTFLDTFERLKTEGRVIILSDDVPLDELLAKINDYRFSFCITRAFAMGDKSTVGFKKRLCQEVYKNIKTRYDECLKH